MANGRSSPVDRARVNLSQLIDEASATQDEVGLMLRIHMLTEIYLTSYLEIRLDAELQEYVRVPKYFSEKLALCVALGMPLQFAAVVKRLNQMRNEIAHEQRTKINLAWLRDLEREVNRLDELNSDFVPLEGRLYWVPKERRDETSFEGQWQKLNLVQAFFAFYAEFHSFLASAAKKYALVQGLRPRADSPPARK